MRKLTFILTSALLIISSFASAQTPLKEQKAGHSFYIGLPDYMSKTSGLNNAAAIQFKSSVKDVYGFIIFDTKDELEILDIKYSNVEEYFESSFADIFKGEKNLKMSEPVSQKKAELSFVERDVTYYSKETKSEIYYLIGAVETKTSYYKFFAWSSAVNKDKFKQDFQAILYSIHD